MGRERPGPFGNRRRRVRLNIPPGYSPAAVGPMGYVQDVCRPVFWFQSGTVPTTERTKEGGNR